MIKAIIFDCFGVLVGGSLEQFIEKHFAKNQQLIDRAHSINDRASIGQISYRQQLQEFAEMARIPAEQVDAEMDSNPRNDMVLSLIKETLKGRYKLGFLSNASDNWLDDMFTKEDLALFDDIVLSFDVGMVKPDLKIYELAASRLAVEPEECLFIDDIARYCEAAELIGMQTITYVNFRQFKQELNHKLGI